MFRFCSKTVPERGRRALRRRSGERSVALQELPPHVGYRLVIFNKERAYICMRVLYYSIASMLCAFMCKTSRLCPLYSVYALRIHAQDPHAP